MSATPAADIFLPSNSLKALSFLADHPGQDHLSSDVRKAASMSRAGTYMALQQLVARGLAAKQQRGRFHLYSVEHAHPLVKQFKVLKNVAALEPLLALLRPLSLRIVLFGSAARGEDAATSDVDIFVLARDAETIRELIASFPSRRAIRPVIVVPAQWPAFRRKESVFAAEIGRGIVLWEEHDEPGLPRLSEERQDTAFFQRKGPGRKGAGLRRVRPSKGRRHSS